MLSFFKSKKAAVLVPQWSRLANAYEYIVFKKAVQNFFKDEDVNLNFEDGLVNFAKATSFGVKVINLVALYKYCLSHKESQSYQASVEEFIGDMRKDTERNY